ncbi:hypothetical protein [Streptomyces sp. NPDC048665]|uniref:hypothetical protein n=1 Tax=Streptomyces sp. NPDC048665 TaxID=3155490 RepID=UPI003435308E
MNLKKFREQRAAHLRHRQLMRAADRVVSRHVIDNEPSRATAAEVAALVFGWHGLRVPEDEATEYLNAVLADRGFPLLPSSAEAGES